ncbi:MAG TPA: hypothetical protein VE130_00870 [Nitrososphaeraceae archaeon]|jgi:hypothetical protein|nr:hypothetical protein [Nitrososphaeraceae archaeon]
MVKVYILVSALSNMNGLGSSVENPSAFLNGEIVSRYLPGTGISSPPSQGQGKEIVSTTGCPTVWC